MTMRSVYITGTASFLPGEPVGNDEMETVLGQAGGRPSRARRTILRSNGIKSRHYAIDPATGKPTHTNAQLTAEAVRRLEGLPAIDILACGTSIPDQVMPNHAAMVQGELKMPACEVIATSGVCLSGVTALKYAYATVAGGLHSTGVATGSDCPSPVLSAGNFSAEVDAKVDSLEKQPELAFEKDFLRWMLSDGAGAFLLQDKPREGVANLRIDWIETFSYAGEMETCMYAGASKNSDGSITGWSAMTPQEREADSVMSIKQDVRLLNENVIHYTVERPLPGLVQKYQLRTDDIDYFLPHYSSEYFRDKVHAGLKTAGFDVPQDRWFTNLTTRGNTGAASIYIMIDELARSGDLTPGQRLLCWIPESGRFSSGFMHLTVA
ncbi:MAG TPA: beta-ketoacyl-ACP synthase III [Caulobacter sp.]|nr:beta-ketoacyl-ACP synthase III [Caulobacter sp.]